MGRVDGREGPINREDTEPTRRGGTGNEVSKYAINI